MSEKKILQRVGANEPCPCGSGKTHIECCLDSASNWVKDEQGNTILLKSLQRDTPKPSKEEDSVEEIPLLRLNVKDGKFTYTKSVSMSRIAGFPADMIRFMISSIEVEKQQVSMEAFGSYINRSELLDIGEDEPEEDLADTDSLGDGTYDLLITAVDGDGVPQGLGGTRISESLSEESLLGLIGALEEIKTDITLCLIMNCMMNGMMGTVDNL